MLINTLAREDIELSCLKYLLGTLSETNHAPLLVRALPSPWLLIYPTTRRERQKVLQQATVRRVLHNKEGGIPNSSARGGGGGMEGAGLGLCP